MAMTNNPSNFPDELKNLLTISWSVKNSTYSLIEQQQKKKNNKKREQSTQVDLATMSQHLQIV